MTQVYLAAFSNRDDAVALARETITRLNDVGVDARLHLLDTDDAPILDETTLVVSLGGDGTFLKSARLAHEFGARVLAVNLGRLGFLLPIPTGELLDSITRALDHADVVDRLALQITMPGGAATEFAFNEVVVERARAGSMARVKTFVADDEYLTYSADGVMVATPTGSTGYSFSAGGPVVDATLQVMIITPIAPHFTIDRSIVVDAGTVVRLVADEKSAVILADGRMIGPLAPGECIEVRRSPRPVRVVATERVALGFRLRESLREGHA